MKSHRDNHDVIAVVGNWPVMWRIDVPEIGRLTCYGAQRCIVHIMDYYNGEEYQGFDVYTPVSPSNRIATTLDCLRRIALGERVEPNAEESLDPGRARRDLSTDR